MNLRLLVILQIALVAFLGAAFREGPYAVFSEPWATPAMRTAVVLFYPVWIGFPILGYQAVGRSNLPVWKCWIIAGVEAALVFATLLALWPAVS